MVRWLDAEKRVRKSSRTGWKPDELHKPLIRRQPQPVANTLSRSDSTDLQHGVGLPLHHGNVTALIVLPYGARGSRGFRDNAIRDARLRTDYRAIKDSRVELRELEGDTVRLHRARDRRRDRKGREGAKD